MKLLLAISAVAASALAAAPASAKKVDDVAIGAAFLDTCVRPAPDRAAIRQKIAADGAWSAVPVPAEFGLVAGAKSAKVETWARTIDGHEVLLAMIEDDLGKGLKTNCAFVIRDERQAMWYFRSVSDHLKDFGLKLKEQDIPHFRVHRGKLAGGAKAEAVLRSKSAALPGKDVLHLAIAF